MKKKKIYLFLVVAALFGVLSFQTTNVNAAADWQTAIVIKAGYGWGIPFLVLQSAEGVSPAWGPQWFTIVDTDYKSVLATALTAAASNINVWAFCDPEAAAWSAVSALCVISEGN